MNDRTTIYLIMTLVAIIVICAILVSCTPAHAGQADRVARDVFTVIAVVVLTCAIFQVAFGGIWRRKRRRDHPWWDR